VDGTHFENFPPNVSPEIQRAEIPQGGTVGAGWGHCQVSAVRFNGAPGGDRLALLPCPEPCIVEREAPRPSAGVRSVRDGCALRELGGAPVPQIV
jgi:hypothetical protein